MALKTTRSTGCLISAFFCRSTSSTCQEMASPSRSGSVARISLSAPLSARDVVDALVGLGVDLPDHAEIVVRVDRAVLGRQVANMAERGQNLVAGAQIFVDRLGLGRRFNNDDIHVYPMGYWPKPGSVSGGIGATCRREHGEGDPSSQLTGSGHRG